MEHMTHIDLINDLLGPRHELLTGEVHPCLAYWMNFMNPADLIDNDVNRSKQAIVVTYAWQQLLALHDGTERVRGALDECFGYLDPKSYIRQWEQLVYPWLAANVEACREQLTRQIVYHSFLKADESCVPRVQVSDEQRKLLGASDARKSQSHGRASHQEVK